jgi:hypothetical protein
LRQEIEEQAFRCSITHFFMTEDEVSPERSRVFRTLISIRTAE